MTRRHWVVAVAAVATLAWLAVDASYESCAEWRERSRVAFIHAVDDRIGAMVYDKVLAERPEGC